MKKVFPAIAAALALGLCAVGAAAVLQGHGASSQGRWGGLEPLSLTAPAQEAAEPVPAAAAPVRQEGQPLLEQTSQEGQEAPEDGEASPDLGFQDLEEAIREKNLNVRMLEENIQNLEDIDYEQRQEDLVDAMSMLADAQWMTLQLYQSIPVVGAQMGQSAVESYRQQYEAARSSLDDMREGKTQKTAADAVRQLRNAQDQVVMGGQSLYIGLVGGQLQRDALKRQLDAAQRQVQELELRHEIGQISDLQLLQVKAQVNTLESALISTDSQLRALRMNLEQLIGESLTGELHLAPLPAVSQEALDAMDLEADLAQAREVSWALYSANKDLEDAEEDFSDAKQQYGVNDRSEDYRHALRTWQIAQYTYEDACSNFELKFRTLYNTVKNDQQVCSANQAALESQQAVYAAQELRYQQGSISENTLLSARDELSTAQDNLRSAADTLFSDYNSYCWARNHGILN